MAPQVPKFKIPLHMVIQGGKRQFATVEQDSLAEIEACVENVLLTPLGDRLWDPEYGLPDQTFKEGGADLFEIQNAISMWEPRADTILDREPDKLQSWIDDINLIIKNQGDLE